MYTKSEIYYKNNKLYLNEFKFKDNDQHFGWGWNENGQLGINSYSSSSDKSNSYYYQKNTIEACVKKPTCLNNQDELYSKAVSIGLTHSLLIDSSGKLYSTGKGQNGRTGLGNESTVYSFKQVIFNDDEINETNKYRYTSNYYQSSNSRILKSISPYGNDISIRKVIKISCGGAHSAFITESFELFTFGRNDRGQLGHGLLDQLLVPKKVKYQQYEYDESTKSIKERSTVSIDNVDLVACGLNHTVFSLNDGCVYSMGDNKHFQLGYASKEDEQMEYRARLIESLNLPLRPLEQRYTNIKSISCGSNFSCIIKQGNIYTWGINTVGQCGYSPKETKSILNPKLLIIYNDITTLSSDKNDSNGKKKTTFNFIQVSCGNDHSLALTSNGEIFAWGESKHGQIGISSNSISSLVDNIDTSTPIKIREALTNEYIVQISAGAYHSMALSTKNHIYCWGLNDYYQVGEETESIGHQKIISTPYRIREPITTTTTTTTNKSKKNNNNSNRPILQISAGGRSSMAIRRFLLNIEIRPTNYYNDIKRVYQDSSFTDLTIQIKNDNNQITNQFKLHKLFLIRSKLLLDFFNDNCNYNNGETGSTIEFNLNQLLTLPSSKRFIIKNAIEELYEDEPKYSIYDDSITGKEIITQNYDTNLSQHLFSLLNQELYSDIKIKVDYTDPSSPSSSSSPVIFNAHKCILVNRSEKFKTLLESSYFKESIDNIITINNFTVETYEIYLKYLYTDILNLNNENVIELFQLSHQEEQYRMKDLIEEYLSNSLDYENVSLVFELALQLNDSEISSCGNNSFLIDRCIYYMAQNLDKVQKTESFKSLSDTSKNILLSNSINIKDEILKNNNDSTTNNNQDSNNNNNQDNNNNNNNKTNNNNNKNKSDKCIIC